MLWNYITDDNKTMLSGTETMKIAGHDKKVFLLQNFGKAGNFFFVYNFRSIMQPISNVRLVNESPFPFLSYFPGIAVRNIHGLSADIDLDAFSISEWPVVDLH